MFILYFLSFFSKKSRLKLGEKIWDKFDAQLPEAHGVIEDDKPRMEEFSKLLDNLSRQKKKALREWLEQRVFYWTYGGPDFCFYHEEELERKWLQIYREHLRVLKSKTP